MSSPKLVLLLTLLVAAPAFAAESITVEQLSAEVATLAKEKDAKAADQLDNLQLTQRLNGKELSQFEAALPGPKSRQVLVALADRSEFLDPPPADIPNRAAPSVDQQRAMIAKSIDYAESMLKRLPDLFANRNTIRFENSPPALQATGNSQSGNLSAYQPMHQVSQSTVTVLYRKGQEVTQESTEKQGASTPVTSGMVTYGEFGPILSVLYGDLPKGNLRWGHWESDAAGSVAVFRFDVPRPDSHYLVRFCCIRDKVFQVFPAYHGELTLDPVNGTILRVTLIADMTPKDLIAESELLVEYGPVELGEKKYFCPVRSVSVARAPMQEVERVQAAPLSNGITFSHIQGEMADAPIQILVNETVFDQYHLFRGDVHILGSN